MKFCFIIVFITCGIQTFHVGTTFEFKHDDNNLTALKAIHKNVYFNCQKFLCPLVDAPVCVKLKFREKNKNNVIVRLMNDCEKKYVKCTQGAKAVPVPMVYCDERHPFNKTVNIRRKRSLWKHIDNAIDEFNPIDFIEETTKPGPSRRKAKKTKATAIKSVLDESVAAACPKRCPSSKRRMVCAKCAHGIYRSFLSVCHLRLYQCRRPPNEIEPLELVSRDSCIFSAPYFYDKKLSADTLHDYEDTDPILWYDYCRKNNLLGKHPKCIF